MKPVIAIFDIGKTNKKLFLFDEEYRVVWERSVQLTEITDEDDFPCEDIQKLNEWILHSFREVLQLPGFEIRAIQFATYGASLVYVNEKGEPLTPLYNYLKPYPGDLSLELYREYGGEESFSLATCSPALGNLNSGLQWYRLFRKQVFTYNLVKWALHLPQYISSLFTHQFVTEITSIGCHTALWDFQRFDYHDWVYKNGLDKKLPVRKNCDTTEIITIDGKDILAGVGLHDSSAALIPYLAGLTEPFVLISTGTWCISLNPFNREPLTAEELKQDCLCYYTFEGKPVKAARLFAGNWHEQEVKQLAAKFQQAEGYFQQVEPREQWVSLYITEPGRDADSYEEAYHQFMGKLVRQQVRSTGLVLNGSGIRKIIVDGGFAQNAVFMRFLSEAFAGFEVFAATMTQATALGAALSIHRHWNSASIPARLLSLQAYTKKQTAFNS